MSTYSNGLGSIAALSAYKQGTKRHTGAWPDTVALTDWERHKLAVDLRLYHPGGFGGGAGAVPLGATVLGMTVVARERADPQDQCGTISGPGYEAL